MSLNGRLHLKGMTQALTECAPEGTRYAKCVAAKETIKQNDCQHEFTALRNCVVKAMKKATK